MNKIISNINLRIFYFKSKLRWKIYHYVFKLIANLEMVEDKLKGYVNFYSCKRRFYVFTFQEGDGFHYDDRYSKEKILSITYDKQVEDVKKFISNASNGQFIIVEDMRHSKDMIILCREFYERNKIDI